jgi:hypothetical protein
LRFGGGGVTISNVGVDKGSRVEFFRRKTFLGFEGVWVSVFGMALVEGSDKLACSCWSKEGVCEGFGDFEEWRAKRWLDEILEGWC